jgi:hypothetical protein
LNFSKVSIKILYELKFVNSKTCLKVEISNFQNLKIFLSLYKILLKMYKVLRKKRTGNIIEEVKGETVGLVKTNIIQILPEGLELESGEVLPGPIDVAYETYGTLNEDKSNVILVCHALSGSAHAAGYHRMIDEETFDGATEGWWEDIIGPGKGIDTNKFFVICSNFLGSCYGTTGPTSVNPKTGKRYGITFPTITISDMVKVQRELIRQLGIEKLLAVVGGSMVEVERGSVFWPGVKLP